MRWAWAAAVALLWPQLALLGGVGARREQKRPRQPGQRTEPLNATLANSEGLPGSPKVRAHPRTWAPLASGASTPGHRRPTCPAAPPGPFPSRWGGAWGRVHRGRGAWEGEEEGAFSAQRGALTPVKPLARRAPATCCL